MKKSLSILILLALFLALVLRIDFQTVNKGKCPFCQKEVLDAQVFFKSETALGLITHKPVAPGHVLIIPKRHVERFEDLTAEEIAAIGSAIKEIDVAVRQAFGNKDYLLLQKNGREAGQSVPHLHFHYLPAVKFLAFRFFLSPWLKSLNKDEMALLIEDLMSAREVRLEN